MSLPDHLKGLMDPRAYPHPVRALQLIETHISWIVLTGEFAYKIKRPVTLSFIDLSSRAHRDFLCHEELRLNARFAPALYLGVCRITQDGLGAAIDGQGPVIELAVRMRQFERAAELDALLQSQRVTAEELGAFGRELANIHLSMPRAGADSPWGRPPAARAALLRNLDETVAAVTGFANAAPLQELRGPLQRRIEAAAEWFAQRRESGKVRECHGDLHCGNIVRVGSKLLAFDCLEFEPAFRWIDVADEIAFLLADLDSYQASTHARAFLSAYLEQSGDYEGCQFLDLYKAHRSLVRAKVTALSAAGEARPQALEQAQRRFQVHLECARESLVTRHPLLLLMSGLSGSGKTWLARRLAPHLGALHLSSDVQRRRLAALAPSERSSAAVGEGLYSAEMSARVYDHLLLCAEQILTGGYTAIVDATFAQRAQRGQFVEMARRLRVRICLIHCQEATELLRARIAQRQRQGGDASEADLSVLEWQQQRFESIQPDEQLAVLEARTSDPEVLAKATRFLHGL